MVLPVRNSSINGNGTQSVGDEFEFIAIQPKGSQVPLYLVHELFGGVQCYGPLGRILGDDQPIYAFRSLIYDHDHTIEEIASLYLSYLRAVDPVGPYLLGGYSFGGIVAFEMARQLYESDGCEAELVFMFDSWIGISGSKVSLWEQAKALLRNAKSGGVPYVSGKISNKLHYWRKRPERAFLRLVASFCERLKLDKPRSVLMAQIERANKRAIGAYRPLAYEGRVLLMVSAERLELLGRRGDHFHGWGVLADKQLEICSIQADHPNFLDEPSVQILADTLRSRLSWLLHHREEAQTVAHR